MVTLAVAAILLAIAVPALRVFIQNNREDSEADSLISSLDYARSEAVKRDANVEVCASVVGANAAATPTCSDSTAWNTGWIVETTGQAPTVLQVKSPLQGGNTLSGAFNGAGVTHITFEPNGFVKAAAGSGQYNTTYFTLCDGRGAQYARDIEVSAVGAAQASPNPGQTMTGQALACP
ncbi:type-4 fimbrial pilin related signal peptide protein [mine drainage metagenome]|uniref:Type-4 fimbrial pilin related signal peptide protein n=1 Tax=mine drainage metagenome TaxID=410659 RepID=T0YSV4_9ZZZZ